jgi:hypothetical protein
MNKLEQIIHDSLMEISTLTYGEAERKAKEIAEIAIEFAEKAFTCSRKGYNALDEWEYDYDSFEDFKKELI